MTNKIISAVCEYFGITPETLQSKTRKHNIVYARQVAIYFKRRQGMTANAIANIIGLNNHTTILYSERIINNYLSYDRAVQEDIDNITQILNR